MPELVATSMPAPGVLHVQLRRPRQYNALSAALLQELAAALEAATADPEVGCAVLSGDDRAFSAGADVKEMADQGLDAIDSPARQAAWSTVERWPKPLVAAVTGLCYGGGHELAMLADIVIAGQSARFAQPEIDLGILPGDGATQRLTRIAGKPLAMQMMLTGQPIDAATALRAGLVSEVAGDDAAVARALEIASVIAGKAPTAAGLVKQAVAAAHETTLSAGLQAERQAIRLAFTTRDQKEGMAAFLEKRAPRFRGR